MSNHNGIILLENFKKGFQTFLGHLLGLKMPLFRPFRSENCSY